MTSGYRGHPEWRDMSEYVVHFTKETDRSAYDNVLSILGSGHLIARRPFGIARDVSAEFPQESVCFSEIPLDLLERLVDRRESKYGLGFSQDVLIRAGGARVWYADKDSGPADRLRAMVATSPPPDDLLWTLTPFIDFPGEYGKTQYRFEWEREWRVPLELAFTPEDVAFLFVDESKHDVAKAFFRSGGDGAGPEYHCPILDPLWDDERIQKAFAEE